MSDDSQHHREIPITVLLSHNVFLFYSHFYRTDYLRENFTYCKQQKFKCPKYLHCFCGFLKLWTVGYGISWVFNSTAYENFLDI